MDDDALIAVAKLLHQCHDLSAGTHLAGSEEVVCHNDLSPRNTVYHTGNGTHVPFAFIDWDLAAPGRRVHDVAHMCWQWLDPGPAVTDVEAMARHMALIAHAYGLAAVSELVPTILWWQDRCWRGIEDQALRGSSAMRRLARSGVPNTIRDAYAWTMANQEKLGAQLEHLR